MHTYKFEQYTAPLKDDNANERNFIASNKCVSSQSNASLDFQLLQLNHQWKNTYA